MQGVNKEALINIVSQIKKRKVDSAEDVIRIASVLRTYDDMFPDHQPSLAEGFVTNNQITSQRNLTTKQILESIIEGTDLTPLMGVQTVALGKYEGYNWQTDFPEHQNKLHQLRRLGHKMYEHVDVTFNSTSEYNEMIEKAQQLYDSSTYWFELWESIVGIDPAEIVATTPLVLAREIFSHVKWNPGHNNIYKGIRALLYIDQQNPDPEIFEVARTYASYFIDNTTKGTKRAEKLINNLQNVVDYKGPVQEAVV